MTIIGVLVAGLTAFAIFGSRGPLPAPGATAPPLAPALATSPPLPRVLAGSVPMPQIITMPRVITPAPMQAAGPVYAPEKASASDPLITGTARVSAPVPIRPAR